jgi:hypothetical protein
VAQVPGTQAEAPTTQTPEPYPPSPEAGGLTAPPPLEDDQLKEEKPKTETEKKLGEADEKDAGRPIQWFYAEVEGGFQHVGLETFEVDENQLTAGFVQSTASGGFVGTSIGAKLFSFVTLGPRFRIGFFPDFQMFSIGGEVGLRIPIGMFEPAFSLGAGYTALGSFSDAVGGVDDAISIRGADVRVAGGLDIFVTDFFAVGFGASWEFLALFRPGVDIGSLNMQQQQELDEAQEQALAAEGSGFGSAINLLARVGLHL